MESTNEVDDGNIENIDFKTWTSWTYKMLYHYYKLYMSSDECAGILLKAKLQYHRKLKSTSCCGRHNPEMSYTEADVKPFFRDIGKILKRMLQDTSYNVYKDINGSDKIQRRDVLIWSVLINRRDYAFDLLKERSTIETTPIETTLSKGTRIYAALFASALFKVSSAKAADTQNKNLSASFMENSRFFEVLACNGIAQMYMNDRAISQKLLTQPVEEYGCSMKTVMKISSKYELMQFMSTSACQTKLKSIWRGNMSILTSRLMIQICIFLPFLIPCIKFVTHKKGERRDYEELILRNNWCGCTDLSQGKIGIIQAFCWFFGAPVTKFWTNLILQYVMLGCFSYFVLTDLHPFTDGQFSLMEYIVYGWIVTLIFEELRQIKQTKQRKLWHRLRIWWKDTWNKFDVLINILFLLSAILRFTLHKDNFALARKFYSVTLAAHIIRSLQYFHVSQTVGPKIIMIGKMIYDVIFLIMIFAVVVLSFGLVMQTNLYPNSEPKWKLIGDVVYLPYWQMFGELFLDTIQENNSSTCTTVPAIYRNDILPRCPESDTFVIVVVAVYMVITHLMLLSLLVAMFSYTFQKIQDNSVLIWRFHRYSLVHEYYERPALAPPLNIIYYLYMLILFVYTKLCKKVDKLDNAFELDMSDEVTKRVAECEGKAMDECVKSINDSYVSTVPRTRKYYPMSDVSTDKDYKLNEIAELCNQVNQKLNDILESRA